MRRKYPQGRQPRSGYVGPALFEGSEYEGAAFVLDLTERKEAKERQKAVVDELSHRVKNTLATVLALSAQTFRNEETPSILRGVRRPAANPIADTQFAEPLLLDRR